MEPTLCLHSITSLDDDLLLPWLDLYENAFPPVERTPVSSHIRGIRDFSKQERALRECFALLNPAGAFLGMAQWGIIPAQGVVYLGYLAVTPDARGQGLGGRFYQLLLERLSAYPETLFMFDVERPDTQPDEASHELAQRRIHFYQRQGAGLVTGLTMEWGSPPIREYMMVQPLAPCTEEDMLRRTRIITEGFGGQLLADPPGAVPGLAFDPP